MSVARVSHIFSCLTDCCFPSKKQIVTPKNETGSIDESIHGPGPGTGTEEIIISIDEQAALVVAAQNIPTHVNYKDTVKFVPPITEGFVVKVYDGDTITIASKLPYEASPMYRFQVRLNGIDTPEIKGVNEDEKIAAVYAKNEMIHLVMNKTVHLKNVGTEKYGRILADVYVGGLHVNQWMLDNKFAVPYGGGTKKAPESWVKYQHQHEDDDSHDSSHESP
jgi:micrococcal nuclease